jgi:hypothetical protein
VGREEGREEGRGKREKMSFDKIMGFRAGGFCCQPVNNFISEGVRYEQSA